MNGDAVNETLRQLYERKSVRAYTNRTITAEEKNAIIAAALQAPTAGNQILYTIIDVQDPALKAALAESCDHQPFIAEAPLVLVFLADCRRWLDAYAIAGADPRKPGPGDFLLAGADALIAAQNTVVAAGSLGIGSCYIGDIMENRETVVELLGLDEYVYPAAMVVYGFPTEQQRSRPKPRRFDAKYIVQTDRYRRLSEPEQRAMFEEVREDPDFDFDRFIAAFCARKYASDFAREMNRSAAEYLKAFRS